MSKTVVLTEEQIKVLRAIEERNSPEVVAYDRDQRQAEAINWYIDRVRAATKPEDMSKDHLGHTTTFFNDGVRYLVNLSTGDRWLCPEMANPRVEKKVKLR